MGIWIIGRWIPQRRSTEHRNNTMQHGVEGNTNPTQGQRPLLPRDKMKRGRQSTTTPQALRQGNRAVAKQPDTQRRTSTNTGPGHHKGPTTGGREATRDRGGEPTTAKKRTNAKEPHHTKRGTQGPKEKTPAETQAKAQTQQKIPQTEARHERKRDTKPRTNRRQGKHGPNQEHANKRPNHKKRGGQEGSWTPKRPQKTPPHSSKRAQGHRRPKW